jgi:hypothetical protein
MALGSGNTYTAACQDIHGDIYLIESGNKTIDHYHYNMAASKYVLASQLNWSATSANVKAAAIDQSNSKISLLNAQSKRIDIYPDRTASGTAPNPTTLSLASITNPTGLAINGRTGDYLVVDSTVSSNKITIYVLDSSTGSTKSTFTIDVSTANLSVNETTETNFKIQYDDQNNILYLIAPTIGRVSAIGMPQY